MLAPTISTSLLPWLSTTSTTWTVAPLKLDSVMSTRATRATALLPPPPCADLPELHAIALHRPITVIARKAVIVASSADLLALDVQDLFAHRVRDQHAHARAQHRGARHHLVEVVPRQAP